MTMPFSYQFRNEKRVLSSRATIVIVAMLAILLGVAAVLAGGAIGPLGSLALLLVLVAAAGGIPAAHRQAADAAKAFQARFRWLHFLWILLFLSALVFRVRASDALRDSPLDGWAAYRIGLVAFVGVAAVQRLASAGTNWLPVLFRGPLGWLAALALISVSSALWSVYPAWTGYKSLEYLVDLALVAMIVTEGREWSDYKTLFDCTLLLTIASMAAVWLGVVIAPSQALLQGVGTLGIQMQGVMPVISANGVGDLGAVTALIGYRRLMSSGKSRRALYAFVMGAGLVTLILAQARSALAGLVVGIVILHIVSRRAALLAGFGGVAVLLVVFSGAGGTLWSYFLRGQSPELFASLSGRKDWWAAGWAAFLDSPLIGYGGYAGSRFVVITKLGNGELSSIHNALLEILLGTGILGFIPFAVAVVSVWWLLFRYVRGGTLHEQSLLWEAAALMGYATTRAYFTTAFVWHPDLVFLQVLALTEFTRRHAGCPRNHRKPAGQTYISVATAGDRSPVVRLGEARSQSSEPIEVPTPLTNR